MDASLEYKQSPFQSSGLRKVPGTQQVFNKCIQRQGDRKGKEGERREREGGEDEGKAEKGERKTRRQEGGGEGKEPYM